MEEPTKPLLTLDAGLALINSKLGVPVAKSRFHKDSMKKKGVAPKPVATFGRRHLYTEEQMLDYGRSLITELENT